MNPLAFLNSMAGQQVGAWAAFFAAVGYLGITFAQKLSDGWPSAGTYIEGWDLIYCVVAFGICGSAIRAMFGIERRTITVPTIDVPEQAQEPQPQPPAKPPVPIPPQPAPKPPAPPPAAVEPPKPSPEPTGYKPPVQSRDTGIDTLARTIWAEARGEPREGQRAVAEVIANRTRKPKRFRPTVEEVCLQPWQFSCWNENGPTVSFDHPTASDPAFMIAIDIATACVDGLAAQVLPDGTDHYYAPAGMVPKNAVPSWAEGREPCVTIGGHIFYNNIP